MKKLFTIITILIFTITVCIAEDTKTETPNTENKNNKKSFLNKNADSEPNPKTVETKSEQSEFEEKTDIIQYGLGEDIINLIKTLQADKDLRFDSDLQKTFSKTKIPEVRNALFEYFAKSKNDCLKQEALLTLENRHDANNATVKAAINYIRLLEIKDGLKYLHEILKTDDEDFSDASITAIGKIGGEEDAVFLAELFESEASDNEKKSLIKKQNIMVALEELHNPANWDFFKSIAENTDENSYIRSSAASALGKIGDERAVPILSSLFEDKDPLLRAAAVKGIAHFKTEAAQKVLIEAFKDSYYKVRLQAVKSAMEEKNNEAVKHILYRVKKDPETTIRYVAIEALSELNSTDGNNWAVDAFTKDKTGDTIKLKIAEYFLKNNLDLIYAEVEKEILTSLAQKNKQKNKFALELGKVISKIENEKTAPIAEAFINHKEAMYKSLGLDMFKVNKYSSLTALIQAVADDEKNGALSKRAKDLLSQAGFAQQEKKEETPNTKKEEDKTTQQTNKEIKDKATKSSNQKTGTTNKVEQKSKPVQKNEETKTDKNTKSSDKKTNTKNENTSKPQKSIKTQTKPKQKTTTQKKTGSSNTTSTKKKIIEQKEQKKSTSTKNNTGTK